MAHDATINNKVVSQMIEVPAASQRLLEAAARGIPPRNPSEAADALVRAKGWLEAPFKDAFKGPDDVLLVAIAREDGVCDVVRAAYPVGGLDFDTAQTRHLLSVRIRGYRGQAGATNLSHAEEAAKKVFLMDDRIKFEELGTLGGRTWGKQAATGRQAVDTEWPHWLDRIYWWTSVNDVGFVTVKALGGPTREVIGPFEEMNISWFHR